jgi:halogenation protein CepH
MDQIKILIAGGGPAGATLAAILAKEGLSVTLIERERFPRHHVGESLQPASFALLDFHLGLGKTLSKQGFPRKYGAIYEWGDDHERWSVLFDERLDAGADHLTAEDLAAGDYTHAYQVERSVFDQILLDHAAERGVNIRENTVVTAPLFTEDRCTGLRVCGPRGEEDLTADFVIDATGSRCLMGRHLKLTQAITDLQATATYGYFVGAGGVGAPLHRTVQVVVTIPEGWVWFIPVSPTRTSVGVVTQGRKRLTQARFEAIIANTSLPLEGATLCPDHTGKTLRCVKDWSYTHSDFVGPGWLMIGDAACFTDPILSGGVDFAIRSACNAAVAILRAVADPALCRTAMNEYQAQLRREFGAYLRLARYWYANNRRVEGLFWESHERIAVSAVSTPLRAFVYQTSGDCDADAHFHVFSLAQEQKIFRKLTLDPIQLKDALRRAQRHLENRNMKIDTPKNVEKSDA